MPANLTPEYYDAEEKFRAAGTPEEKLNALELMMATIPKHKGTEKMRADIKRRMSKLRKGESKKSGKSSFSYSVEKQGASQVILVGPPNSGKTRFVNTVSNAHFAVGDYPYTTHIMQPAMMPYENVQIQLVDTPAIHPDYYEKWVLGLIRAADVALLVADLANPDFPDDLQNVIDVLEKSRIFLSKTFPDEDPPPGTYIIKTILLANKADYRDAEVHLEILNEFFGDSYETFAVSCETGEGIEEFRKFLYDHLDVVRVYTKAPGSEPDFAHPFVLDKGKTVEDLAVSIHKDVAARMKFARIWGEGYYDGQPVDRHHPLGDGDVIEIHT